MCADDFVIHEWEKEKWDEYEKIQRYNSGFKKGRAKGKEEGREENVRYIIKKMLENNLDLNIISQISGKSISQIKKIQKKIST